MPSMAITWAQRLKQVFNITIATCQTCGGALRIIACIDDCAGPANLWVHPTDYNNTEVSPFYRRRIQRQVDSSAIISYNYAA